MRLDKDILSLDELSISVDSDTLERHDDIRDGMCKRSIKPLEENPPAKKKEQKPQKAARPEQKPERSGQKRPENTSEKGMPEKKVQPKENRQERPPVPKPAGEKKPDLIEEEKTSYLSERENELVLKDLTTGSIYKVDETPYIIGKKSDCSLIISDEHVSRHHAEIRRYRDKVYIRDLGSLNGTFVDAFRLPKEADLEIHSGQELMFANRKFIIRF